MLFSLALLLMTATASQPQIQVGLPEHLKAARQTYLKYYPSPKQKLFHKSAA
jgi:hypothetical protein